MNEEQLHQYFTRFGQVEHVTIIDKSSFCHQYTTNRYGFITFKSCSLHAVKKLLHNTDPVDLKVQGGRTLTVGPAKKGRKFGHNNWSGGRGGDGHGHGYYVDHRRRPVHHQWIRRGDKVPHQDERNVLPRKREDKSADGGDDSKSNTDQAEELPDGANIQPQGSVIPVDMSAMVFPVPYPQQPMASAGQPGYDYSGMMYPPLPYPSMQQSLYPPMMTSQGYTGYYDYSYSEQFMIMPGYPGGGPMYWPGASLPVLYPSNSQVPCYNQPGLGYYPPLDYNLFQPQPVDILSDSGFHDLTSASIPNGSILYGGDITQVQETSAANQSQGLEKEEGSPILNLSHVLNNPEAAQGQPMPQSLDSMMKQQQMFNQHQMSSNNDRTRCYNTPYKQFTPFTGGHHLDPQGNKFPFVKGSKVRRHSGKDVLQRNEKQFDSMTIIQPSSQDDREINTKRDQPQKRLQTENQPDLLKDSLHQNLMIK